MRMTHASALPSLALTLRTQATTDLASQGRSVYSRWAWIPALLWMLIQVPPCGEDLSERIRLFRPIPVKAIEPAGVLGLQHAFRRAADAVTKRRPAHLASITRKSTGRNSCSDR